MDPIKFVKDLELAPVPVTTALGMRGGFQNAEIKSGEEQAFVSDCSLSSFAANVSPKARQDVLDTTLLASMAAEKKYPNNSNPQKWYEFYTKVLISIGWVKEQDENKTYTSGEAEFDIDQAVIEIMASVTGGPVVQAALIRKTLESLRGLADDDGKVRLFEARAKGIDTSHFQIGMTTEENEAVSLHVSNFVFENIQGSHRVLFFRWGQDRAALNYQFFKATLNSSQYADTRFLVKQKLGSRPAEFIGELDI
jgi:hypothetical protein